MKTIKKIALPASDHYNVDSYPEKGWYLVSDSVNDSLTYLMYVMPDMVLYIVASPTTEQLHQIEEINLSFCGDQEEVKQEVDRMVTYSFALAMVASATGKIKEVDALDF